MIAVITSLFFAVYDIVFPRINFSLRYIRVHFKISGGKENIFSRMVAVIPSLFFAPASIMTRRINSSFSHIGVLDQVAFRKKRISRSIREWIKAVIRRLFYRMNNPHSSQNTFHRKTHKFGLKVPLFGKCLFQASSVVQALFTASFHTEAAKLLTEPVLRNCLHYLFYRRIIVKGLVISDKEYETLLLKDTHPEFF